jgi:yeast amino acid transporter
MCGGNPQHDPYGFRYWNHPGSFAEHIDTGALGRFEGFLACLWSASFTIVGPEYIAMVAAEAKRPRIYIKTAFKTVYWRFGIFFICGALFAGIVIPYNDPQLVAILSGDNNGGGTAAASPYVIAMTNLGIHGLPHLVNALLVTSIFSAGNTYTYCATRSLYGMALEGRAPAFLRYCTKAGVPLYCFCIVICFPCLSFLSVGSGSSQVLTWLVNLITAGGIIDYIVMTTTYICFYNACKVQGFDRSTFPYTGRLQPFSAYFGLVCTCLVCFFYGYSSFEPPDVATFFSYYTMVIVDPILFFGWKIIKRTKLIPARERDLVWERPIVDAYEASFTSDPVGFWTELGQMIGIGRYKNDHIRTYSVDASALPDVDEHDKKA